MEQYCSPHTANGGAITCQTHKVVMVPTCPVGYKQFLDRQRTKELPEGVESREKVRAALIRQRDKALIDKDFDAELVVLLSHAIAHLYEKTDGV